jgi:hypothetical protein
MGRAHREDIVVKSISQMKKCGAQRIPRCASGTKIETPVQCRYKSREWGRGGTVWGAGWTAVLEAPTWRGLYTRQRVYWGDHAMSDSSEQTVSYGVQR